MKLPLPTTLKMRPGWPAITSLVYVADNYVSSDYVERHRAVTVPKDARLKNAVVDKRRRIVKRPILDSAFAPVALGPGLGLYVRDDTDIIAITGNTLTTNPAQLTKKLSYSVQPSNSSISTAISVTVQATTLLGTVSPGFVSTVTISLASNPTGASLVGTVTTNAVAGVATFNNLEITRSGEGFKLRATADNLQSKVSTPFNIPTRLTFTVQPDDTAPNSTMAPVEVTAKDTAGNTDTQYTGDVTLATYSGGAGLDGTLTVPAVAGIASFTNLEFTTTGTFSLQASGTRVATAYPPAKQTSNAFVIGTATHSLVAVDTNPPFLDNFGFISSGSFGSIAPTTLNAATIRGLYSLLWPDFQSETDFGVTGNVAQSFFTSVTIGSKTLYTSSAAFSNPGGDSLWIWGGSSGNQPAFELMQSTGTYGVTFV